MCAHMDSVPIPALPRQHLSAWENSGCGQRTVACSDENGGALVKEGLARGSGGSHDMLVSVCHGPSQDRREKEGRVLE